MNPDRWTDYQRMFDLRYGFNRNVGLADALDLCEIEPDGHSVYDACCRRGQNSKKKRLHS